MRVPEVRLVRLSIGDSMSPTKYRNIMTALQKAINANRRTLSHHPMLTPITEP